MKPLRFFALATACVGLFGLANSYSQSTSFQIGKIITIEGEINSTNQAFLQKAFDQAEAANAAVIVLEINTPGGRVDSAIAMSDRIVASSIPSIAVVRNAFSAGALIAMSAQKLAMLPGSEIGAALPITGSGQEIEGIVGEKMNSALRTKFRSVAETRNRNADAAEGMVNPNKVIAGLKKKGEILTLTAGAAFKNKIANFQARSVQDALKSAGFANVKLERIQQSTAEQTGAFLNQPIIAAILLSIGLIGILIELFHPGLTVPGIVGALALLAYFGGSFLTGNGSSAALLFFITGLLLVAVELILIPGSTVVGLLGGISILASIYLQFGDQFPLVAGLVTVFSGIGLGLAVWLLPSSDFTKRFALATSLAGTNATGYSGQTEQYLIGQHGLAVSDLRPAGVVMIEGHRLDVVSDGEFVLSGTQVIVMQVEGRRILVKPMKDAGSNP